MGKLIIDNRSNLSMAEAVVFVAAVVSQGRISMHYNGEGYCFVTQFYNENNKIVVAAFKNKKSDRLLIYNDN